MMLDRRTEVLPAPRACPFACGCEEVRVEPQFSPTGMTTGYRVVCKRCDAKGPHGSTPGRAVSRWNGESGA